MDDIVLSGRSSRSRRATWREGMRAVHPEPFAALARERDATGCGCGCAVCWWRFCNAASMSSTIALIRHAEKPSDDGRLVGVDEAGFLDANELTVRGWQRAGALARFFAGFDSGPPVLPSHLVAAAPDAEHPSKRSISTLLPLAGHCGLVVATPFHVGAEDRLAQYLDRLHGLVVVAWEHKRIPALARLLAADAAEVPPEWPKDRFDLVWLLVPDGSGGRRFAQLPQQLLGGDLATVADGV